jgi:hypothetical protein
LERLRDVLRIGVRGQAFRDFLEAGRKQGKSEAEIVEGWKECERAVKRKLSRSMRTSPDRRANQGIDGA